MRDSLLLCSHTHSLPALDSELYTLQAVLLRNWLVHNCSAVILMAYAASRSRCSITALAYSEWIPLKSPLALHLGKPSVF